MRGCRGSRVSLPNQNGGTLFPFTTKSQRRELSHPLIAARANKKKVRSQLSARFSSHLHFRRWLVQNSKTSGNLRLEIAPVIMNLQQLIRSTRGKELVQVTSIRVQRNAARQFVSSI